MKKWSISCFAISLVFTLFLSGCGGAKTPDSNASGSASPAVTTGVTSTTSPESTTDSQSKPITLQFWAGLPPEGGSQSLVDKWNQANPNIQVQYTRYVNDDPGNLKLDTALLSSTDAPDIFTTYGDARMSKRVSSGVVEPLDDMIAKDQFDVDGIIGNANVYKYNGITYYLPGSLSLGTVLINKTALDAIGEKVPTSWTWDDFAALAKKLTNGKMKGAFVDPSVYTLPEMVLSSAQPNDYYIGSDGLSVFNNPAMKKGLELEKKLEDGGVMTKYSEVVAGKMSFQDQFLNGEAAMLPAALYLIRYVKDTKSYPHNFQVAFAPMPQYQAGGNVNTNGGMGDLISIRKNDPNKAAAMKFLEWYLTIGDMDLVAGGRIPSNKKVDSNQVASLLLGETSDKLFDSASFKALFAGTGSYTYPTLHSVPVSTQLLDIYKTELEKYLLNADTIDQALSNMKSQADDAIEKAKQ